MPIKRKIVTIAFLSLGFIVIGIGIARLFWLLNAFKGNVDSYSVQSAYTAIESSVAIIGTSGPTIKYILSRCIPWLRPSFERASTNKSGGNTYGNNSAGHSRVRSKYIGTGTGYDDLDSVTRKDDFEMKGDWGWRHGKDDDGKSDELIIPDNRRGITKSVEVGWTVHKIEDEHVGRALSGETNGRPAASPAHII